MPRSESGGGALKDHVQRVRATGASQVSGSRGVVAEHVAEAWPHLLSAAVEVDHKQIAANRGPQPPRWLSRRRPARPL